MGGVSSTCCCIPGSTASEEDSHELDARIDTLRRDYEDRVTTLKEEHETVTAQLTTEFENKVSELQRLNGALVQRNEHLEEQVGALAQRNKHLEEQVGRLEVQGGRQAGAYSDSVATPNDVQLQVERIRNSLATFTKAFMYGEGKVLGKDADGAGARDGLSSQTGDMKFARTSDVKFWYQKHVSESVFWGFEAEDFQIPECYPTDMDLEKRRTDTFRQYKELVSSLSQGKDVWMKRLEELATGTAEPWSVARNQVLCFCQPNGSCTCGGDSLLAFCYTKAKQVLQSISRIGNFWIGLNAPDTGAREEDIALRKKLHHLLIEVWLCHLLVFSFDPPCTILKAKVGCAFDKAYMESVTIQDDEDDAASYESDSVWRVAFVVVPGFHIGKAVVRAKVYLHETDPRHLELSFRSLLLRSFAPEEPCNNLLRASDQYVLRLSDAILTVDSTSGLGLGSCEA